MKRYLNFFILLTMLFSLGSLLADTRTDTSTELMVNGDFELWDDSNTPSDWDLIENIDQESVIVRNGNYSAKHTAGRTKKLHQNVTGIIPGETYTISFWFLDNDPNARCRIWSYWLDGTTTVTDNSSELRPNTYSSDNPDWQSVSHTLLAPASADGLRFEVRVYNDGAGGGSVYYDDFSVLGPNIETPELLTADFTADQTTGDQPFTVNFSNLVSGGLAPYTYSWDFNGDDIEDSSEPNPAFTYNEVGTYSVKLTVTDSNSSQDTEYKTDYITVTTSGAGNYYTGITATEGLDLKTQIKTLISSNTNTSYDGATQALYSNIANIDNTVTGVYTGLEVGHNYGDTSVPTGLNCEHTYAQSWIDAYDTQSETTIAKADVHHLFPVKDVVNSARSNRPFDNLETITNQYSEVDNYISYLGSNIDGYNAFEPADQHKGNVARALLYMNVRYNLPLTPPAENLGAITFNMLPTLLAWHVADPVDDQETTRNDQIHLYQSNRNPFIDHPEWVDAIWGDEPLNTVATPTFSPDGGTFDSAQSVTITTQTADALIYYTLDDSLPTSNSNLYSSPIEVSSDITIKAIAMKEGWNDSQVATASYQINQIPQVSIYDIQYVTDPTISDVSPYSGQTVNVTGIVTGLTSAGFAISSPTGGAWNGVYVYDDSVNPAIGDQVVFNGEVTEYLTLTEIINVNSFQILSQGNTVESTVITTNQVASEEAWEGVLATVENVTVTTTPNNHDEWYVDDGSGLAQIDNDYGYTTSPTPYVGQTYQSITGIVDYTYGSAGLNPRYESDVVFDPTVNQVPIISDLTQDPLIVYATDDVVITANILDYDGHITIANLHWGTEYGVYTTSTIMTQQGDIFTGVIPAQAEETVVYYQIEATDDDNDTSVTDEASYTVNADVSGSFASELFFSEYIEGSAYNKAIEIFNGTGLTVDLSEYSIMYGTNGGAFGNEYQLSAALASISHGEVLVLAHSSANATILAQADATPSIINHNGNDVYGLFKNGTLIDIIGTGGGDPGSGWDVAGVNDATKDHTLVRKPNVFDPTTDWSLSAGTDASNSQWIINSQNDASYLGSHQFDGGGQVPEQVATPIINPAGGSYFDQVQVEITTDTPDASIYYTLDDTTPTVDSQAYTQPFILTESSTVKTIAVKENYTDSEVALAEFTIQPSAYEDGVTVSDTLLSFESEAGIPSSSQAYTLYLQGANMAIVEVSGDFLIQDPDGNWGSSFFFETIEEEVTINVVFNATYAGISSGQIIHYVDGFDDVVIELSGNATEPQLTSIYDIQYTEVEGDGTYPSSYDGQTVTVQGIVVANNYGGKYFISSPDGGAWKGLYVYDSNNDPDLGDLVRVKGVVDEYYGWTELTNVSEFNILSQNNQLPEPLLVTTADLASNEAYESVLVKIENVEVTADVDNYGEWYVSDGSGDAQIDDNCYGLEPEPVLGDRFDSIVGMVDYSYDLFGLNPRSADDIVFSTGVTELDTPVIISVNKNDLGIEIIWQAVVNANSYKIYSSDTANGDYILLDSVENESYLYTGNEVQKFFKIQASTEEINIAKKK